MKPLGKTQQGFLSHMLYHNNQWYDGCGWLWNTPSGTRKIAESLEKRGLLTASVEYDPTYGDRKIYRLIHT